MTEPSDPTGADLDAAIFTAARALIAARFSRDAEQLAAARAEYERLIALKNAESDGA